MRTNKSHIIKHISKRVSLLPLYLCELLPNQKIVAHELGRWMGLPHTFETSNEIPFIINASKGGTNHNFMDYNIRRKRWYKIQLIKTIR
jgi:hypothetical protein